MNSDEKLTPTNIAEILEKTNENLRFFAIRETEWIIQKNAFETKIAELEGELAAHEQINIDLMKRIKMLEYALIQERNKNSGMSSSGTSYIVPGNQEPLPEKKELMSEEELYKLKEKAIKPSLLTMLNEIGINESFASDLFTNLELNKAELEMLIKRDMEERTASVKDKLYSQQNTSGVSELKLNDLANSKADSSLPPGITNTNSLHITLNPNNLNQQPNKNIETNLSLHSKKSNKLVLNQNNFTELRSHFDVVRKLSYMPKHNNLVTVSEDCLINIWAVNKINFSSHFSDLEPTFTFRGHTGPLYSLETKDDLIYTAGNEGIIKIWRLPRYNEVPNPYGDVETLFNCNIAFLQKTNEVVWDLRHHPTKNLLIALSADGYANIYKTGTADEFLQSLTEQKIDKWFSSQIKCAIGQVNPTVGNFSNSDNNVFICGLTDGNISYIDVNKGNVLSSTKSSKQYQAKWTDSQVDSLASCFSSNLIYAGYEDGTIKYFDSRTDTHYIPVNAHSDSVTSISMWEDLYLFSTSHDTKVKMWDVRDMSQPVQETLGSQRKWDEAICDSVILPEIMSLATAGADSIIRIFKL